MEYYDFLDRKLHSERPNGIEYQPFCGKTKPFQEYLIGWALETSRAAILSDCGTGKSLMELEWAINVTRHANKPVLILTPLAVAAQFVSEGQKFGIDVIKSDDGKPHWPITVTNYEKLNKFEPEYFAGVVCDESSILKSFSGARSQEITKFMRRVPYRLLATATAAPNDFIELGTSSEALGYLGNTDMLTKFFKNDNNTTTERRMYGEAPKWRFRGHSELPFWRWVCSWARACRKPSDLGFSDDGYVLPDLIRQTHVIKNSTPREGMFIPVPADNLAEQREEKRNTINERCDMVSSLVDHDRSCVCWCQLNDEGDLLKSLIPGSEQVSGSMSDDRKEAIFNDFTAGNIRCLVTKPKIGAWGLNWQHCSHTTYFPSHSFEQYYQSIRRFWRFGQQNSVTVDIVATPGEEKILANLANKETKAGEMFNKLVQEMNNAQSFKVPRTTITQEMPTWLRTIK